MYPYGAPPPGPPCKQGEAVRVVHRLHTRVCAQNCGRQRLRLHDAAAGAYPPPAYAYPPAPGHAPAPGQACCMPCLQCWSQCWPRQPYGSAGTANAVCLPPLQVATRRLCRWWVEPWQAQLQVSRCQLVCACTWQAASGAHCSGVLLSRVCCVHYRASKAAAAAQASCRHCLSAGYMMGQHAGYPGKMKHKKMKASGAEQGMVPGQCG